MAASVSRFLFPLVVVGALAGCAYPQSDNVALAWCNAYSPNASLCAGASARDHEVCSRPTGQGYEKCRSDIDHLRAINTPSLNDRD